MYAASVADPATFWARMARDNITWFRDFTSTSTMGGDLTTGDVRWFADGQLNVCYNCVDRHVAGGRGDEVAIIWEADEPGRAKRYTYAQVLAAVCRIANVLTYWGVKRGDTVAVYMPMIPDLAFAMLACARIGAVHSVVFGGFASHELAVRIDDAKPRVILAGSAGFEGASKVVPYGPLLAKALEAARHRVDAVFMYQRPGAAAPLVAGRDLDWEAEAAAARDGGAREGRAVEWVDANHPQYIIYTSGSTGAPKGVVRDTGGHAVALRYSMGAVFDCWDGDVWWAASDPAWVVGASYMCYAPLLRGCATVMFEGKPVGTPDADAYWRVVRDHGVKAMFTAPTAIRAIKREDPDAHFLRTRGVGALATLFLAGERSDPDTVRWAQAATRVPVIDHYWQTGFGWLVLANCRGLGLFPTRPGSAGSWCPPPCPPTAAAPPPSSSRRTWTSVTRRRRTTALRAAGTPCASVARAPGWVAAVGGSVAAPLPPVARNASAWVVAPGGATQLVSRRCAAGCQRMPVPAAARPPYLLAPDLLRRPRHHLRRATRWRRLWLLTPRVPPPSPSRTGTSTRRRLHRSRCLTGRAAGDTTAAAVAAHHLPCLPPRPPCWRALPCCCLHTLANQHLSRFMCHARWRYHLPTAPWRRAIAATAVVIKSSLW